MSFYCPCTLKPEFSASNQQTKLATKSNLVKKKKKKWFGEPRHPADEPIFSVPWLKGAYEMTRLRLRAACSGSDGSSGSTWWSLYMNALNSELKTILGEYEMNPSTS